MTHSRRPRIHLRFSFFVFNALLFMLRDSSLTLMFYTVCAIHEAGHIAAASFCGIHIVAVDITGFGIIMKTSGRCLEPQRNELAVLLAGPAVNVLAFVLTSGTFAVLNLAAAVYNLLPYRRLDGGAILALIAEGSPKEETICRCTGAAKVGISAFLLLLTVFAGFSAAPLFIASVILLISEKP